MNSLISTGVLPEYIKENYPRIDKYIKQLEWQYRTNFKNFRDKYIPSNLVLNLINKENGQNHAFCIISNGVFSNGIWFAAQEKFRTKKFDVNTNSNRVKISTTLDQKTLFVEITSNIIKKKKNKNKKKKKHNGLQSNLSSTNSR